MGLCVAAVFAANTINVGADLGAIAAGGSMLTRGLVPQVWLLVPVAVLILALQLFLTYSLIFKIFKWLTLVLFAYVVTGFIVHPDLSQIVIASVIPHLELNKEFIAALVAIFGTTISPYLFFWQASSEVDEMRAAGKLTEAERRGVNRAELRAARTDILVGMFFSNLVMYFIMFTTAAVLHSHGKTDIQSADQAAQALAPLAGPFAFVLFAGGMIGTGLLAIPILTGSAGYAVKDFFGLKGALSDKPRYRPTFYAIIALSCAFHRSDHQRTGLAAADGADSAAGFRSRCHGSPSQRPRERGPHVERNSGHGGRRGGVPRSARAVSDQAAIALAFGRISRS